jgi:6-phosphogluconolactonase (cycloisomerase 2 family)
VAGGNGQGNAFNQLNSSYGVFVDANDALFVADYNNHRVMKWERGASNGTLWAGGQCGMSEQSQLCNPSVLVLDKEGTLFVTVENGRNGSVIRWKKEATSGETLITANTSLYGIALDKKEEYFYLGHHREHRVVKYMKNGTVVGVVAGGNDRGDALNQLDYRKYLG